MRKIPGDGLEPAKAVEMIKEMANGIGPPLTRRPSHTTVRTAPYTAVRLIRQNQLR